jgi:hypothetical protein
MATQLNDEGRIDDEETRKTQKGYEAYQDEGKRKQKELEARDQRVKEGARKLLEYGKEMITRPSKSEKPTKMGAEGKREQTKKMRPPTANESSALELNRGQYKLGRQYAETDPKNDKTFVDFARRESVAPKLQNLSTFKEVPEEVRDYEAYKDAGYKKGGIVKSSSASSRGDGCAQRGKTRGKVC